MKKLSEKDEQRLDILNLFGLMPFVNQNTIFDFWNALYWGRNDQPFANAWEEDGENVIPNKINVFSMRKPLSEMGTGRTPYEAYEHALEKLHVRRKKRDADFLQLISGKAIKNGSVFYYLLHVCVYKIEENG